ncbi:nucleoside 2-deoxyribosyltransferase domain-containing protein [Amycolatopsis sp. GM8]|uniref:nucleoside 2-deoxyribosyltransferase domain-containing protein n=1 Tax=Amycolatopsis sp. GM8 TaxID=2896530 RepID=UPI001F2566FB|nr:nucleoside 2-deoxyribosyltransferase domain-containing protein [Amycolatopsis sp. GM8]
MPSNVILVHAGEEPPEGYEASIFLCGPTPRTEDVDGWRPKAIAEITSQWRVEGDLVVFVPEPRNGERWPDYDDNRTWELRWGDRADVVLFWIPRGPGLPGHTTNDEFGRWKDSGRVVLGTPPDAEHVNYQRDYATEAGIPLADDLANTVALALDHIGVGARRADGHRHVPLLLWRTGSFQNWLTAQERAGNKLRSGRLEWTFRVGPQRRIVLFWAFHAVVWVAAEQREKANEVVLSRPDISTVVAYHRAPELADTEVVIVREFRSPATTADGFVRELPGGSGFKPASPIEQAVAELAEETGIKVTADRIHVHQARQPAATLSGHQQHVFAIELTRDELQHARTDANAHGVADDTERTYVEIHRYGDLLERPLVDWATLGAITAVLLANPAATVA